MKHLTRAAGAAVLIAAIYGLGWVCEEFLVDYVVQNLIFCGIFIVLAVGLNLINGTTGQFSLGHAGFMAVGAYATAVTTVTVEAHFFPPGTVVTWWQSALVFNFGLLVGGLCAGLAGLLVGTPSLRLKGDYLAIVTLGFAEIIRLIFNNTEALGGATGYRGGRPEGLPIYTTFFWVFVWVAIVILVVRNLTASSFGRTLLAIREDEIAAEAVGLQTAKYKVLAFVVSSMAAGVGGGLFAHLLGGASPEDFKFDRSVDMIVMIIVGGLGSVTGAVVGAVFVTLTRVLTMNLPSEYQQYRLVAYALILILLMILRPQGLLGRFEITDWFKRRATRKVAP